MLYIETESEIEVSPFFLPKQIQSEPHLRGVTEVWITAATIINCNDLRGNPPLSLPPELTLSLFQKKKDGHCFFSNVQMSKRPSKLFFNEITQVNVYFQKKNVEKKLGQIHLKTTTFSPFGVTG